MNTLNNVKFKYKRRTILLDIYEKIVVFMIKYGIINAEDKEIYKYGFELLLADVFNLSVMLFIGVIVNQFYSTILYIIIFIGMRSFCGGYHAKTHLRCHICTIGIYIVFLVILLNFNRFENKMLLILFGNFIAAIPITVFSPIQNPNKPLSEILYKRNRIISIILFFFLMFISIIMEFFKRKEGIIISLTLWIVSCCIIPVINIHSFIKRKEDNI